MPKTITQFHRGNGKLAKPNVYKRSLEARDTTDSFLRAAAGLDEPPPRELKLKVWHLAVGVLLLVAVCVGLFLR